MSVRIGDRQRGKIQVLNSFREFKVYSYQAIKSEKNFPKSSRWIIAYALIEELHSLSRYIRYATTLDIPQSEVYLNQIKAKESIQALYEFINDAYDLGYINSEKVEYWTGLLIEFENDLDYWTQNKIQVKD